MTFKGRKGGFCAINIFAKRPLALVSAIVIFTSFIAHKLAAPLKIAMLFAALVLFLCALAVSIKSVKGKFGAMLICLCAVGAILGISVQLLAIDMRAERARSFDGDRYCELLITDEKDLNSQNSYAAVLRDVDGKRVSFDVDLCLLFDADLDAGDIVRVSGSVSEAGGINGAYAGDAELDIFVYDRGSCALISKGNFSFKILFNSIRESVSEYMSSCFGEKCGALARGIFLGDTDGIDRVVIRDFRRAGVSHLLAVSGLHISMLVAMLELILLKLSMGRRARVVIISLLSLVFLGMTGFAMSACRSVFMLLFVYLHYLFVKESDSLTALFTSVAVIMLISPSAAVDVGLWLSFLATLGIISVYSPVSKYFKTSARRGFGRVVLSALKKLALAILLCFVCNVFTSFVVWIVFGEVSLVTLISNLLLTPLSLVFLVSIPIGMLFANFGFIGDAAVWAVRSISELIEYICGAFSAIDGAVISLGYWFAGIIILAMSASLAVMLVINMKRKMLVLIPPIAAVLAFAICLFAHNAINVSGLDVTYRAENSNEMLFMSERSRAAVIDISSGAYSFVGGVYGLVRDNYATEIEDLVITHYHASHPASLELLCRRTMLERVYLPTPRDELEWRIAREIADALDPCGCEVVEYKSGDTLTLLSDKRVRVDITGEGGVAIFVANKNEAIAYIGDAVRKSDGEGKFASLADHVILGVHGGNSAKVRAREGDRNFILH